MPYCNPDNIWHIDTAGLSFCSTCTAFHHNGYGHTDAEDAAEDEPCEDCQTRHTGSCPRQWCSDCDEWHERDMWGDITCPGWYCESCDDGHRYGTDCPSPYCEDCGDYHALNECPNCYCSAPRQSFTVPNDGQPPLASDERATVHLAAGQISDEGLAEIRYLLQRHARDSEAEEYLKLVTLSYELGELGAEWQTRQGNYTKRLSRHAYQNHGLKLTPELMSQVGTIARDHSTAADVQIDVTRDLNRPAEDFYHEDSCWWGSYGYSRCALKSNGGFGLRSFNDYGSVSGRAWVMPLRRDGDSLVPTFNTENPDALVVFNGYGELSGYTAPRVMAAMYGWTYTKISFDAEPMYINSGGYLVGPEDIVSPRKSITLSLQQHASLHESELANA